MKEAGKDQVMLGHREIKESTLILHVNDIMSIGYTESIYLLIFKFTFVLFLYHFEREYA